MQVRTYEPTNTRVRVFVCVVRVCVLVCVCVCELIKTRKGSWKHAFRRSPRQRKKKEKKGKIERKKTRLSSVSQKLAAQISTLPNAISQQQRVNEEPPV